LGNMSGLPGAVQLIPSEHFPRDARGQPWNSYLLNNAIAPSGLYASANSPPGLNDPHLKLPKEVVDDLVNRIQELGAFHKQLGPPAAPAGTCTNCWLLYGTGVPTETAISFNQQNLPRPVQTDAGDGTVPALSAEALGLPPGRQIGVPGVLHADACLHREVRRRVRGILQQCYGDDEFRDVPVLGSLPAEA